MAWINNDFRKGQSGWSRQVQYPKNVAPGFGFGGANVHFARIHIPHGRADYVAVGPGSGAAYVWKNSCDNVVPADPSSGSTGSTEVHECSSSSEGTDSGSSNSGDNNGSDNSNGSGSGDNDNGGSSDGSEGNAGGTGSPDTPLIPFITIGDSTFTANSATQIVISGQTLSPGGQITAGGTTVSLGDGGVAVVDGATQTVGHGVPGDVPSASTEDPNFVLTLGGTSVTANSNTQFVIAGQTLTRKYFPHPLFWPFTSHSKDIVAYHAAWRV